MSCPFLREGRARYCHAAAVRKLILDGPGASSGGRCTSAEYVECELVRDKSSAGERCPHLEEIHVQYCGAAPVPKLVPFSESELSRCTSDAHRYCDSYLALARPHRAMEPPQNLLHAPNHLWLEVGEAGLCHVGIDAFLAEVAGSIDGVTFITTHGTHRPAIALTVNGVEWPMLFPNPMLIRGVNSRLRRDPKPLTADPYGAGWLFEGWELPGRTQSGLLCGPQAAAWQAEERQRLATHIHETQAPNGDGGHPVPGVARLLPKQDVVRLFQRFFSKTEWVVEE
jgi:glycine cleavage system H lipoate-binding protein